MSGPEQTAAAPIPKMTPVGKHVVDDGVEGGKLKIFMDFYFCFVAHLVGICFSIAESLGLREPAMGSLYNKRVRRTCVSLSEELGSRLNYC